MSRLTPDSESVNGIHAGPSRPTAVALAIQKVVDTRLAALSVAGSFHSASDEVRRDEYQIFAASVLANLSGIQAMEWVPRVADVDRATYEAIARAEGHPEFRFTERSEHGELVPAARRPQYCPVYYLEPYAGNEAALGFDMASDVARKAALEAACDTGHIVATERIRLVQGGADQFGFLAVRVLAQALAVTDGDQQQVQGQGRVGTAADVPVADQAVVDPTELGGHLPQLPGAQHSFDHRHGPAFRHWGLAVAGPRLSAGR